MKQDNKLEERVPTESFMVGKCEVNVYGKLDTELFAKNIHKLLSKKDINILEEDTR